MSAPKIVSEPVAAEPEYAPAAAPVLVPETVTVAPQIAFSSTRFTRRKQRNERIAHIALALITFLMVVPLLLIVGYLLYEAAPILSFDFIFTNPRNGMRAGGIWAPLLGTPARFTTARLIVRVNQLSRAYSFRNTAASTPTGTAAANEMSTR